MSALVQIKGGIPVMVAGTAPATSQKWEWQGGYSNHIIIQNLSAVEDILISFTAEDSAADRGILIPPTVGAPGNPLAIPVEASFFYTKASGAAAFNALVLLRRG